MLFGTPNDSGTCGTGGTNCSLTDAGNAAVEYYGSSGILHATAQYNRIGVAVPIIFEDGTSAKFDGWNLYTGGFSLGSTPDFLFSEYHSQFASTACGGSFNDFPANYDFNCDPQFDAISNAGEFQAISTPTLTGSASIFQEAASRLYDQPSSIGMYSRIQQFAELNGFTFNQNSPSSSAVVQKGHGTQTGFWSLLNAQKNQTYTPANAIYTPGGPGAPNLIRRGFSQDPDTLNVFQATTVWDFEVISQVFDSMLAVNPTTGGADQQVIDWMTTSHSQTFQPNEIGCIAGPSVFPLTSSCVRGITTQTWHLRSDLQFHDNTPVLCQDIVYSILTQRDVPSANGFPSVAFVTNASCLDTKTVQVKLESNSAYYELNIGGVPIIPQHLYQGPGGSICGSITTVSTPAGPAPAINNGPSSACADPAFDPLTCTGTAGLVAGCGTSFTDGSFLGIFVGSADYVCNNADPAAGTFNGHRQAFGKAGGSCVQSGAGALIGGGSFGPDSRVLLTANENYMRGPSGFLDLGAANSLAKSSWADVNKDGIVNILDVSNAAFFFDSANTYWAHPNYSCTSTATIVDVCDMAALVVLFDTGITAPFGGTNVDPSTQLQGLAKQIDSYLIPEGNTGVCLGFQWWDSTSFKTVNVNCKTASPATLQTGFSVQCELYNSETGVYGAFVPCSLSSGGLPANWATNDWKLTFLFNGVEVGHLHISPDLTAS
jgi:ABC-type transport system substrate-binding protein